MYNYRWKSFDSDLMDWNNFLRSSNKGYGTQTSFWLESYTIYGFNYQVLIAEKDAEIVGGIGIVISRIGFIKTVICPIGPILKDEHLIIVDELIDRVRKRSKKLGAIACQINLPILKSKSDSLKKYCLDYNVNQHKFYSAKRGNVLRDITTSKGFMAIKFPEIDNDLVYNELFKSFSRSTRRNIKIAQKGALRVEFATSPEELRLAYKIISDNAKQKGFAVRDIKDIEKTLLNLMEHKLCIVPICLKVDEILGALILFEVGNRLTNVMGGIKANHSKLKIGDFIHNEMIKYSIEKKYKFYDISLGGSKGVIDFKRGFSSEPILFERPIHWVFKERSFKIYSKFLPKLRKYKILVSKYLKALG